MAQRPARETVDLSAYPDLVVIYLGMRVNTWTGIRTLMGMGPRIRDAVLQSPEGLLRHEWMLYSPRHVGMRQYWRDLDALEAWSRSEPHRIWWRDFLRDSGGTGFWHETYLRRGGVEAVYVDVPERFGLAGFASVVPARGPMFSARTRAGVEGSVPNPAVGEDELYGK